MDDIRLISHRGNVFSSVPELENSPNQILAVLHKGFGCEIDVWKDHGFYDGYWLGHDEPQYPVPLSFFTVRKLWIHCKNDAAYDGLKYIHTANIFKHVDEPFAVTTHNFIWTTDETMKGPNVVRMVTDISRLKYAKIDLQTRSIYSYCCDNLT